MTRLASIAVLVTLASSAVADTLQATRNQPLFEAAHSVDIRIADGIATYTVRRMFSNPGKVADQVELRIDLPYGAAATGLRIRANERWHAGVLMERDKAAALYEEMTGFGSAVPKDPALLAWVWADKLSLQVFPVMPGSVSTVEYTLTAPTRYENGRYFVSYPRGAATTGVDEAVAQSLPLATPVVTVRPAWGGARTAITIDNKRVARDTPIVLLPPPHPPWLELVDASPSASYVSSSIEIPRSSHTEKPITKAAVSIELPHTYKSDLRVDLLTPGGELVAIHDGSGGGDNDIRGTFVVELPARTTGAGIWRLVVSDHAGLDTGTLDRWSIAFGEGKHRTTAQSTDTPLFVPDAPESEGEGGVASISVSPPSIDTWQARLGRVVASSERAFARLEIDVAPQLAPMPKRAQVVFVLDTSYSIGEHGVAAQLDLVRAYMQHVPDAEVEIVTYRRRAQRALGRFVPASELADALAVAKSRGAFALGNGSALDEGARLATRVLAKRKGPRRIVVTTDELLRSWLDPTRALAAFAELSPETVVHVVVPSLDHDDRPHLRKRAKGESTALAPLATRHHGIFVELHGLPAATLKSLVPVVLELVRPTRIENVAVTKLKLDDGVFRDDHVLHEGDGLRVMLDDAKAPTSVTLTGMLWSDPIRQQVPVTTKFSIATAAYVFGADVHHELSEAEQMRVAMFGRAVSPVTSYVAAEPGVRPSTIGLDEGQSVAGGGFGTIGHGSGGGGGYGVPPNWHELIGTAACIAKVRPAAAWSVTLQIETSYDEVLDVVTPTANPMASCLAELTWALRLDRTTFHRSKHAYTVELTGPPARRSVDPGTR